jgi:hypothetical protein
LLVHVHHRAVSGAADDNGERGNVKPDVRRGARRAYWVLVLFGAADDNGERGNVKPDVRRGARRAYWVLVLFL